MEEGEEPVTNDSTCGEIVRASLQQGREILRSRSDWDSLDIRGKFSRFAREAKSDLEFLCRKGANPLVLICIIYVRLWWWCGMFTEEARTRDADRRRLQSHVYWRRGMRVLAKAEDFLSSLQSNRWVPLALFANPACDASPLIPLSKQALQARSAVSNLLKTVRALGLDQPGWELVSSSPRTFPRLLKTGRAVRGRPSEMDWGKCAATIHSYLKLSTGNPHWISVVRLLRAAGAKEFAVDIPGEGKCLKREDQGPEHSHRAIYTSVVRNRIGRLSKDANELLESERIAETLATLFPGIG
jgi:hypothetical protein